MVMGMNLVDDVKTVKTGESVKDFKVRVDRVESDEIMDYKSKKNEPYNLQFSTGELTMDVVGRVERKDHYRKAQIEVGFRSWVLGVFSGLIVIMFAWGILEGFDSDVDVSGWESSSSQTIISSPERNVDGMVTTEAESIEQDE